MSCRIKRSNVFGSRNRLALKHKGTGGNLPGKEKKARVSAEEKTCSKALGRHKALEASFNYYVKELDRLQVYLKELLEEIHELKKKLEKLKGEHEELLARYIEFKDRYQKLGVEYRKKKADQGKPSREE